MKMTFGRLDAVAGAPGTDQPNKNTTTKIAKLRKPLALPFFQHRFKRSQPAKALAVCWDRVSDSGPPTLSPSGCVSKGPGDCGDRSSFDVQVCGLYSEVIDLFIAFIAAIVSRTMHFHELQMQFIICPLDERP